jgi:hypothetical protein
MDLVTLPKFDGFCGGVEYAGSVFQPAVQPVVKAIVGHSVSDLWNCFPSLRKGNLTW